MITPNDFHAPTDSHSIQLAVDAAANGDHTVLIPKHNARTGGEI